MMKRFLVSLPVKIKVVQELGPARAFWYAVYQLGLRSGHYRRVTPVGSAEILVTPLRSPIHIPIRHQLQAILGEQAADVITEADEIAAGKFRLFGGPPVEINLVPPSASHHWTFYENNPASWVVEDIKYMWEPARFGWAYTLGRAYILTGEEKYPAAFWHNFEVFQTGNPPNQGPNWSSAQEVALRLLAFLFAARVFESSPHSTPNQMAKLGGAVAAHARRIPATLPYARAQNNNHRVSEALGLYAAGCALAEHPQAQNWQRTGWQELNRALVSQIEPDGTYTQHSLNYHRLMLHAALQAAWFGQSFPAETQHRLAAAASWLQAQVDPHSGRAPNLGSNDGANILPLAPGGIADFRPIAQAAARAFLGCAAFPAGPWDELGLWLNQPTRQIEPVDSFPVSPSVLRLGSQESWGTLRAVHFNGRPSHADQLHVDLWWRGENIALDAGTYRYTAAAPWDNALAQTCVHNTVEVNGQDQMRRAGRFLWLDWAQANALETGSLGVQAAAAQHNGYRHLGITHQRILKYAGPDRWQVIDHLLPRHLNQIDMPIYPIRLHWLLPDWPWTLDGQTLTLKHPAGGQVQLTLCAEIPDHPHAQVEDLCLVRAGQALTKADAVSPVLGWFSPTYGEKVPALSCSLLIRSPLPLSLYSDWVLVRDA